MVIPTGCSMTRRPRSKNLARFLLCDESRSALSGLGSLCGERDWSWFKHMMSQVLPTASVKRVNRMAPALLITGLLATGAASPGFVTSDPNGGWSVQGYYIHNNMWNHAKYDPCRSTLYAWSPDNWHVVTKMNNKKGDGAVKTYPNVHKDFNSAPVAAFESITSRFAEKSPHVGIYNVAYDIWINGIAKQGCTEIMIWTENFHQTPGGSFMQEVIFAGQTYKVYRNPSSAYIAFVANTNFTSGTVNLLEMINWTVTKGLLSSSSTLNQICFGVEMVSTDDMDATFEVSAFSIETKLKKGTNIRGPVGKKADSASSSTNGATKVQRSN
jgi:hypothetical protein